MPARFPYSTYGVGLSVLRDQNPVFTFVICDSDNHPTKVDLDELFANGGAPIGYCQDTGRATRFSYYLRTSAPHIFAAGDVTGRLLLVPPAIQDGFVAATNAVCGTTMTLSDAVNPIGSFTDPEYAQVGLTESQGRAAHEIVSSTIHFDATTRTIIDGRTFGFCKLIVDRATHRILGCHVVGERAVEITQLAAIAITAGMRVDELAQVPLSFPTYAGILGRVAASVTRQLNRQECWQPN
jgi:pyruvate/2-oxoglutarate dehydrogenase complex dihydrolipoamide dehydrogenase (E3) component